MQLKRIIQDLDNKHKIMHYIFMAARKKTTKSTNKKRVVTRSSSRSNLQPVHLVMLGILAALVTAVVIFFTNASKNQMSDLGQPIDVSKSSLSEEDLMEIEGDDNSLDTAQDLSSYNLDEQNNSGQSGKITVIDDENGKAVVTVRVYGGDDDSIQPAHIHSGACGYGGGIRYDLTSVVDGQSKTTLTISTQQLLSQRPLSVNVHISETNLDAVACSNL